MKLHEALARVVAGYGVDTLFGVLGDGNMFFADSFVRECGGHYSPASHEAGAVGMAQGYAARGERLGVATITHGPGLANAFTSIVNGVLGRTPVVVIAGETPESWRHDPQNIDQREIVKAAGAQIIESRVADDAPHDLANAIQLAIRESKTVVFSVPSDLMWATVDDIGPSIANVDMPAQFLPTPIVLEELASIVANAQRPIVLVGKGVRTNDRGAILSLAERVGAPLATTLRAKGAFHAKDACIGIFGTLSTSAALDVIAASDAVIAFGSSLNYLTTDRGALLADKRVVRVDTAPDPQSAPFVSPLNVTGDAGSVARALVDLLDDADIPPRSFRSSSVVATSLEPARHSNDTGKDVRLDITDAMLAINEAMPKERTLVTDGGRFMRSALRNIEAASPEAFVFAMSFHSVGTGMPAAIGAGMTTSDPVLFITGDGGFMMSGVSELYGAVREGLDLVVVICNDGGYGAEYVQFTNRELDPAISLIEWPEFAAMAIAMGCSSMTVHDSDDLARACEMIAERSGPLVIDLRLDPSAISIT